jgi:hypothetical protein
MSGFLRVSSAIAVLCGAVAASDPAAAGVGYYYEAPSYYYAPPVYGWPAYAAPGAYGAGFYGAPAYGGYVPAYYNFATPYSVGYSASYESRSWGYPTYGYISPYQRYGYRPYRYGPGRGLFDLDD